MKFTISCALWGLLLERITLFHWYIHKDGEGDFASERYRVEPGTIKGEKGRTRRPYAVTWRGMPCGGPPNSLPFILRSEISWPDVMEVREIMMRNNFMGARVASARKLQPFPLLLRQ